MIRKRFSVQSSKLWSIGFLLLLGMWPDTIFAQSNSSGALVVEAPSTSVASGTNVLDATLRDIKEPVHIPNVLLFLLIALGILVVAIIGFLVWKFWLKKKFEPVVVPPLPPHVRAKRKLREAMAHINEPTVFTVFVSDTIRVYLEEQFNFHAPERTTEEFLHELGATRLLTDAQKKSLGQFLSRCDLIKFAKYDPTKPELEDLQQAAMSLVEETEPKPIAATSSPVPTVNEPKAAPTAEPAKTITQPK
ncbi:MAG: hypothetical protein JWM68_5199 [Verrucomicrobiales bacterium]|nr:hypothetical protein [Verrucomicrobiales bacterium]